MFRYVLVLVMLVVAAPAFAGPGDPPPERPMVEDLLHKEAEILERAKAHDPAMYDDLVRMRDQGAEGPRARRAYLRALARTNGDLRRLEADPEKAERDRRMRELRREIEGLAAEFRDLSERQQKARREEMETLAGELFDLRQAERRARLAEMEARLSEMREEIESRDSDRDEIIDHHLDEMIYGPSGL